MALQNIISRKRKCPLMHVNKIESTYVTMNQYALNQLINFHGDKHAVLIPITLHYIIYK